MAYILQNEEYRSSTINRTDEESQPLIHKGEEEDEVVKLFKRIVMAALSITAVAMIAIGHIYLFDCKVQPYIPIFLMVGGYSSILKCQLSLVMGCCWKNNTACKIVNYWSYFMMLFMTVWFVVGSVWVYGVKKVDLEDTTSTAYCNKTLY